MRLSIRTKIILPFALLLVLVGVLGTGLASRELASAASAQFDANLLHTSLTVNQSLSQLDTTRTAELRLATDTVGVPEALAGNDLSSLARLLEPVVGNVTASTAVLCVVDSRAQVVLRIEDGAGGPRILSVPVGATFSAAPDVMAVLSQGPAVLDRRAFTWDDAGTSRIFWVAPIRLSTGTVLGAALLGESIDEVAQSVKSTAFYDAAGHELASVLADPPLLTADVRKQVTNSQAKEVTQTVGANSYCALFSTWVMRGRQIGYLAVQASEQPLLALRDQLRLVLTLLFAGAAVLTLVVGAATASLLTRPIDALVQAMRAVSNGDLQHRATVRSRDEIGYLAKTFNEMAASLENKTAALETTTFAAIGALAAAIDARDPMTFGHSERVAAISLEIADAMFMPEREREALRRAALLHDLGKIGVKDKVLHKPGPLNAAEADEMREHSQIGYEVLKGLPFLTSSLPGILYHHERWDGAGYPLGLRGTAIPLQVRVLSVADAMDAMCSERPYRQGLGFEEAIAAIRAEAGLQFDPDVVTAFLTRRDAIEAILEKMINRDGEQAEPEAA